MSYGKHFTSMYHGSMRGAGSAFFAVWGYVISHMMPNKDYGTTVDLNVDEVGFLIGEEPEVVQAQLNRMCAPDLKSRSKEKEGRKLVKISEYTYFVVNGDHYRGIRDEEDRRRQNREAQARRRAKLKETQPIRDPINHATPEQVKTGWATIAKAVELSPQNSPPSDVSVPLQPGLRIPMPDQ